MDLERRMGMLYAEPPKSRKITKVEKEGESLVLYSDMAMHRLTPISDTIIRITYTQRDAFSDRDKPGVVSSPVYTSWKYKEENEGCKQAVVDVLEQSPIVF